MQDLSHSLAARLLHRLAQAVYAQPRLFFYPQLLLFGLSVYYTITNLHFDTSRNNLVGAGKQYHQNFLKFKKEFGAQDDLVAVIESEDREKNRQFVERLGAKLEAEPNLFVDVFYKGDLTLLGPKALLFLPEETLGELHETLREYRPFIESFAQSTNLNSLFRYVNKQFRTTSRETNAQNEALIRALPALTRIVQQATAAIERPGTPPSPGVTALFNGGQQAEEQQYITFAKDQIYLVTARAQREELNSPAVERLRQLVRATQEEVPGVNAGITGEPVLEFDEMRQSQKDSTIASVFSLILVALIFIYAYRETGRPIKATLSLLLGLGYTMGYTTFTVGHLNILTVTFLPILIGLAIDFGVHLITRYEEELRHGRTERDALEKAMVNTGLGIFTGCLTTAGAFFAMGLTDFKGIQEMGVITGGGMLICLIPMMTFLPVLLLRGQQNVIDHHFHENSRRARIEKLWLDRPVAVTVMTVLLCLGGLSQLRKIYFDYNLLHMQSEGLPAVEVEYKLIQSASKSVLYGAVIADSLEKAIALERRITNLPTISGIDSMTQFLVGNQQAKLTAVGQIKEEVANIDFGEIDRQPVNLAALDQTLLYTQSYLGLAAGIVRKEGSADLEKSLRDLHQAIGNLRYRLSTTKNPNATEKLAKFQTAFFEDIHRTFFTLKHQDNSSPLAVEDLPEALRQRFIGRTGKYLIAAYPKGDVWERRPQEEFVRQLRTVHKNVTGTPVQLYEYTTLLKDSYITAALYALGAIASLVFIHFRLNASIFEDEKSGFLVPELRALGCVVLALLPVAIGSIWLIGFMGLIDLPFNPANIMTLPLVIGIGVTNGIHILNRFAEEQNPSILAKSTGKAVLVSGLTTVAGFGSLIPAKHQGIASLGLMMAIGVTTCMVAALAFLPALLNLVMARREKMKKPSGDNALSPLGREEPR